MARVYGSVPALTRWIERWLRTTEKTTQTVQAVGPAYPPARGVSNRARRRTPTARPQGRIANDSRALLVTCRIVLVPQDTSLRDHGSTHPPGGPPVRRRHGCSSMNDRCTVPDRPSDT